MRRRNPALYADLVEANLTEEEIGERRAKEMEEERKVGHLCSSIHLFVQSFTH